MKPWVMKAHRVIGKLCYDSWYQKNHDKNGKRYKKHRPYAVPHDAQTLLDCIHQNDEETAKAIFIRLAS